MKEPEAPADPFAHLKQRASQRADRTVDRIRAAIAALTAAGQKITAESLKQVTRDLEPGFTGLSFQVIRRKPRAYASVLYRIRPSLEGVGQRLAFLETVHKTEASIHHFNDVDAEGLLRSNMYFGHWLRDRSVRASDLRDVLRGNDLLGLAARLRLPRHELSTMLEDMKYAEGRVDERGKWRGKLLDYWWIEAPKLGPARDRISLQAWREYAGASTRASWQMARERARGKRRQGPGTDDWFSWRELNRAVGWEVELGEAFERSDQFDHYLRAFMDLHDRRQQNDWDAYRRLLTDYVGVTESGIIPPGPPPTTCLRAVMLGYLKSHEVVVGGNCLSCSRCVPGENFSGSIDERKRVVVRLGSILEQVMEQVESFANGLPPADLVDELFLRVAEEQRQGRSLSEYVAGWSSRLLQDQPDHLGALWVRQRAMLTGIIEAHTSEVTSASVRLGEAATIDRAPALYVLLSQAITRVPREAALQRVLAQLLPNDRRLVGAGAPLASVRCAHARDPRPGRRPHRWLRSAPRIVFVRWSTRGCLAGR